MAKILVLEDDPDQSMLVCDALSVDGHQCITAATVDQAERILDEQPVDLAILDMNLPGRSGLEALTYIRKKSSAHTPVIVVTANPQFGRDANDLGTDLFLIKPINLTELRTLVRRCLDSLA